MLKIFSTRCTNNLCIDNYFRKSLYDDPHLIYPNPGLLPDIDKPIPNVVLIRYCVNFCAVQACMPRKNLLIYAYSFYLIEIPDNTIR